MKITTKVVGKPTTKTRETISSVLSGSQFVGIDSEVGSLVCL